MTTKTHLAESLRRARKTAGLSMKEAGAAVSRSIKTISAWESGQNEPSPEMLLRLCRLYGVSISFFFPPDASADGLAKEESELVENYRRSNPRGKEMISEYAAMVAENHPKNQEVRTA